MMEVEVTDTFAGEANYCWVRRYELPESCDTRLKRVRAAKRLAGYSGVRATVSDYGGDLRIDLHGMAIVIFVSWRDEP
jgi:hypothetical protein